MDARLDAAVDKHATRLREVALAIHARPELRFEERFAAATLCDALEELAGVAVERGLGSLPTAFRAAVGPAGGPRVAVLAEYDALPEIGHACGHNLIAAGALGAFLACAAVADSLPGRVEIIGTPAEEGGGGKIFLVEQGVFAGLDAAIMFHPLDRDLLGNGTLASVWLEMKFSGTASHAAMAPWDGRSALSAVIQTFNLVDSQRVHFRDGTRVHGFITNGGQAVNIIPELAACEFSVRTPAFADLPAVRDRVAACAHAAAMACGVQVELRERRGYREIWNSEALMERFGAHLRALGRDAQHHDPSVGMGSTDMGDVSQVVPSIHPYLAVCDRGATTCHQHAFAASAASERGIDTALIAAKAMARVAVSVLADPGLREQLRREHAARQRAF